MPRERHGRNPRAFRPGRTSKPVPEQVRLTPRCACSCASRSARCSSGSARPPCSSPTTRRKRCRWPTGSGSCGWQAGADRGARRAIHGAGHRVRRRVCRRHELNSRRVAGQRNGGRAQRHCAGQRRPEPNRGFGRRPGGGRASTARRADDAGRPERQRDRDPSDLPRVRVLLSGDVTVQIDRSSSEAAALTPGTSVSVALPPEPVLIAPRRPATP